MNLSGKPDILPGEPLYEALAARNLLYHGDRTGGFIEGWEAHESQAYALLVGPTNTGKRAHWLRHIELPEPKKGPFRTIWIPACKYTLESCYFRPAKFAEITCETCARLYTREIENAPAGTFDARPQVITR